MKIDKLILNEFRCFENRSFSFNPKFNVLIGENGAGKTSILEGLAIAINSFVSILAGSSRPIRKEDVRRISFDFSLEAKLNTYVSAVGFGDNRTIEWTIAKTHRDWGFKKGNDKEIKRWAHRCLEELSNDGGSKLLLPLFCFLGSGRLWTESTEKVKIFPKGSRLEGYNHCLIAKGHFKRFVEWFKTMELSGLQGQKLSIQNADLIRNIVAKCLEGWDTITYSITDDILMAKKQIDNEWVTLPFSYLSDGQRNMIGIIADIAYRCILLNPQLKENAIKETPGIVLIDELDLHLHPNWQRSIVKNLKEAFPNIQFITTTHSPFIVQSLESAELINLDNEQISKNDPDDLPVNKVATEIMGVKNIRSDDFEIRYKNAKELLSKLDKKEDNLSTNDYVEVSKILGKVLKDETNDPILKAYLDTQKDEDSE